MTPEEADEMIRGLNAALRKSGLEWVIQQVAAVVERGLEERKRVALESFPLGRPTKRASKKSEAVTTRPFNEEEQLRLLISAIRSAVINTNQIQSQALTALNTERIAFRPDTPEEFEDRGYFGVGRQGSEAFDSSLDDLSKRKQYVDELESILAELEQMIHVDQPRSG